MHENVFEQVRNIAADVLQVDLNRITAESSAEKIDTWDSVRHLNLTLALEERFGVEFEPEEIDQMKTIAQIGSLVQSKLASAGS